MRMVAWPRFSDVVESSFFDFQVFIFSRLIDSMISPSPKKMIPAKQAVKSSMNISMRPRIMKNNAGRCEIEGFSSPGLITLTMTGDG